METVSVYVPLVEAMVLGTLDVADNITGSELEHTKPLSPNVSVLSSAVVDSPRSSKSTTSPGEIVDGEADIILGVESVE